MYMQTSKCPLITRTHTHTHTHPHSRQNGCRWDVCRRNDSLPTNNKDADSLKGIWLTRWLDHEIRLGLNNKVFLELSVLEMSYSLHNSTFCFPLKTFYRNLLYPFLPLSLSLTSIFPPCSFTLFLCHCHCHSMYISFSLFSLSLSPSPSRFHFLSLSLSLGLSVSLSVAITFTVYPTLSLSLLSLSLSFSLSLIFLNSWMSFAQKKQKKRFSILFWAQNVFVFLLVLLLSLFPFNLLASLTYLCMRLSVS